uniref:60S ribosomal protein L30 n=1 Tax=Felis catus TaxID=9685 RepID=A0ABI7ZSW5_FELCA
MAATKKTKMSLESINSRLQIIMKGGNGKYMLGYKQSLKMIRHALRRSEIEHSAMLAKTGVHHYSGNHTGLGTARGKYCQCAHWLPLIQVILITLETCQNRLVKSKSCKISL